MTTSRIGSLSGLLSNQTAIKDGIRNGQCHILSLEPIRKALDHRWSRNQEAIHDFLHRLFQREALPDDLILKVNDVDFVLIQPSRSAISALSRATNLNSVLLDYFLGVTDGDHISVSIIEQADPGEITARRLPTVELETAATGHGPANTAVSPPVRPVIDEESDTGLPPESPPWQAFGTPRKPLKVTLYKRPEGKDIEALYYSEPVWNAGRGAVGVFQIRSRTFQRLMTGWGPVSPQDLTARTLGMIAVRRLSHACDMLDASHPNGLALRVPLSLDAFAHSSSRVAIMNRLRQIAGTAEHQARLFIELDELPADVPLMRVSEAVAQIKGYVRRVSIRAPGLNADMAGLGRSGADVLVLAPDREILDTLSDQKLGRLKVEAQKAGCAIAVDGVHTPDLVQRLQAAGVREIMGPAITERSGERFVPHPLSLTEIEDATRAV